MKNKLIAENREFYFHPILEAYAGSIDGYVIHALVQLPTLGVLNNDGYLEIVVEDGSKYINVHDFIWECFHGSLKDGEKVKHVNKKRDDNRLENLKLRSKNEIVIKISGGRNISYV